MKMKTADVDHVSRVAEHAWLDARIPAPPARVLDAGCGSGGLARRLIQRGYDVTAIDIDPAQVATARAGGVPAEVASLVEYEDDPFDAVILTFSLHHMHPMRTAVDRIGSLLTQSGVLILEEFAWELVDDAAAAWFYEISELLAAADLLELSDRQDGIDPTTRWRASHADHARGDDMIEAVSERFAIRYLRRTPYLARSVCGRVDDSARGQRVRAELARIERDRIGRGELPQVGFHLVAQHHEHARESS